MDATALLRMLGGLATVLCLLVGALWAVLRFNITLPGMVPGMRGSFGTARTDRRLALVERLAIDQRRSLALVRIDSNEHVILIAPEGHLVVQSRVVAGGTPPQPGFAALVENRVARAWQGGPGNE
jgi:hypothetical protein